MNRDISEKQYNAVLEKPSAANYCLSGLIDGCFRIAAHGACEIAVTTDLHRFGHRRSNPRHVTKCCFDLRELIVPMRERERERGIAESINLIGEKRNMRKEEEEKLSVMTKSSSLEPFISRLAV